MLEGVCVCPTDQDHNHTPSENCGLSAHRVQAARHTHRTTTDEENQS